MSAAKRRRLNGSSSPGASRHESSSERGIAKSEQATADLKLKNEVDQVTKSFKELVRNLQGLHFQVLISSNRVLLINYATHARLWAIKTLPRSRWKQSLMR